MNIKRTRIFTKQYKKLSPKLKLQFAERLRLWTLDPTHPKLRVHPLLGGKRGYWSFNINSDLRVLYYYEDDVVIVLAFIGTHSQLSG